MVGCVAWPGLIDLTRSCSFVSSSVFSFSCFFTAGEVPSKLCSRAVSGLGSGLADMLLALAFICTGGLLVLAGRTVTVLSRALGVGGAFGGRLGITLGFIILNTTVFRLPEK